MKYPSIKELADLIRSIKPHISDECIADGDTTPCIDLTIGWSNVSGEWNYQTGDNSYMGAAYHFPHWAVCRVYRRSNSRELARDLICQLKDIVC